jgi:hypothetical protein
MSAVADATLSGVLMDWAERGDTLSIRTSSGRTIRGPIVLVAADAIGVARRAGRLTLVPMRCVALIRSHDSGKRAPDTSGNRVPRRAASLAAIVGGLVGARPQVAIAVDGEPGLVTGELRAVGADILTVSADPRVRAGRSANARRGISATASARPTGGAPVAASTVQIALAQVSEVTVLASG